MICIQVFLRTVELGRGLLVSFVEFLKETYLYLFTSSMLLFPFLIKETRNATQSMIYWSYMSYSKYASSPMYVVVNLFSLLSQAKRERERDSFRVAFPNQSSIAGAAFHASRSSIFVRRTSS